MNFVAQKEAEGESFVFYEIPLLSHRTFLEDRFDCIILLVRSTASIVKALVKKGWSEKTVQERLKRQEKEQSLREKADFILQNHGSPEELFLQLEDILRNSMFSSKTES